MNAVRTNVNNQELRDSVTNFILWNYGLSACSYDTCQGVSKEFQELLAQIYKLKGETISRGIRCRLIICNYFNPTDKEYNLW